MQQQPVHGMEVWNTRVSTPESLSDDYPAGIAVENKTARIPTLRHVVRGPNRDHSR